MENLERRTKAKKVEKYSDTGYDTIKASDGSRTARQLQQQNVFAKPMNFV